MTSAALVTNIGRLRVAFGILSGLVVGMAIAVFFSRRSTDSYAVNTTMALPVPVPSNSSAAAISNEDQRAKQLLAAHASRERHWRESRDERWAGESEETLKTLLHSLPATAEFRILNVDCRWASCLAVLRFETFAAAQSSWPTVLRTPNSIGCGTEITLDEPQRTDAPFEMTVFYDCGEVRRVPQISSER